MKNARFALALLGAAIASGSCQAAEDYNKTVSRVGTQAPATGYFMTNEALTTTCAYGVVYIDLTAVSGKPMWASIVMAKETGGTIYRLDYTVDANSICTATLVEIK